MKLEQSTIQAIQEHAIRDFPNESCGFVVNGEYYPVKNVADNPKLNFKIDGRTQLAMRKKGTIQAIIHSHPYDLNTRYKWPQEWPSGTDIKNRTNDYSIAWGILATEGEGCSELVWMDDNDRPPLEGRDWKHGITDCYSLIRDYYIKEHNIFLNDYARDMDWWEGTGDLYIDNFEKEGFFEVKPTEMKIGDLALMRCGSRQINHAGVVVGPDSLLHHRYHKLSGVDGLNKWNRSIAKFIRHKDLEC